MNIKFITLSFSLLLSLTLVSTNLSSGPFDKLKELSPVIDVVKKQSDKKKEEEQEKQREIKKQEQEKQREIEKQEQEKQKEIGKRQGLEDFYSLFNDKGNVLKTKTVVTLDEFQDEIKSESTYFQVNDMKEYSVTVNCKVENFDVFPFSIDTSFSKKLKYGLNSTLSDYTRISLTYKLGSGKKGVWTKEGFWDIMYEKDILTNPRISSDKLRNFSISGNGYTLGDKKDNPLNLNLLERKQSLSNGEINILIPQGTSDDKYSLKFNPFHTSWSDYHKSKCRTVT
jgi:hypothetical protein